MGASGPRRGIERKILNSILGVGIIPLILALLVGYITAQEGQSSAAQRALLVAAQKTCTGVDIASGIHIAAIRGLAEEPDVVSILTATTSGISPSYADAQKLADLLERLKFHATASSTGSFVSVFSIYDPAGNLVGSTGETMHTLPDEDCDPTRWKGVINEAMYLDIERLDEEYVYAAQCVAPVHAKDGGRLLGFVSEVFDIQALLAFSLGLNPTLGERDVKHEYQVVFPSEGYLWTAYVTVDEATKLPTLAKYKTDPRLVEALRKPDRPVAGSMRVSDYQTATGVREDAFLAYCQLLTNMDLYLVVYRPTAEALRNIHLGAVFAVLFCVLVIVVLCLNAYRNVHNNIVRPVSLLNEGAQIIGQGDLELKLKIGTGDEIEELASSFNKMALALKKNIGQLEESEEKYRGLVTSMRDGIFQTDTQWNIGFLNPAGVEIFRYGDVDNALGQSISAMFYNPDDFSRVSSELSEKGFIERTRVWMKRCDGKAVIVELSANTLLGDDREAIGFEGIFRDLSKSVRLEREARDRAERLSAINQIANVINSSLEAGRLYESLVVEVKRLIEFDFASLALLDEKGGSFQMRQLWPELKTGGAEVFPMDDPMSCAAWVAQNGERLIVTDLLAADSAFSNRQFTDTTRSCLCVPLYATGRIIGTLNLGSDKIDAFSKHDLEVLQQVAPHVAVAIRNAQLLENLQASLEQVTLAREKLHAANEELKTLDEMKTNLLSNVSHELRTPLVAVMGYTDMIYNSKAGPVTDMQKEYLAISLRNIEKLVTLIENLLDFSRLHRGTETTVFGTLDLVECARSSLQVMKPVADSRGIELRLVTPMDRILVDGDKGKLGQVFNNLLSNAVKFNRNNGSVTVELRLTNDNVEVAVSDTGIGIPREALDKVFTRFYQYDSSSTRKYGGTGIGLSIAQDIARLHGGRITVTSEEGKGSTFRFSLPLRPSKEDRDKEEHDQTLPPAETEMLVELFTLDRALNAQVSNFLISEGINLIQAGSVSHAISLARRHNPDCIIVDVDSPEIGTAMLDDILADTVAGALPVVILTNDDEISDKYRPMVASRVKRGFRKSTLLSGINYAVNQVTPVEAAHGQKILCVDDDPDILTFMTRCLEAEGYDVASCTSGDVALERVATREFGVVLLDIAMPGMDGWEACRRIKTDPSLAGIKVYMVTAKPIDGAQPRAQTHGADGYVLKPFRPEDLIELIEGLVERRSAREA